MEPREPLGQLRHRAGAGGFERRDARLERRGARGLGAAHLVETRLQPFEQRARLGRRAHLLERAHPPAQLVEPRERGLHRGVLVADQPQHLAGHRLQPLLGCTLARGERVEPGGEIGLGGRQGLDPGRRRTATRRPPALERTPHADDEGENDECRAQCRQTADTRGLHVTSRTRQIENRAIKRRNRLAAG